MIRPFYQLWWDVSLNPFIASYPCSAHTWVLPKHRWSAAQKPAEEQCSIHITISHFFIAIISRPHNWSGSFLYHFKEHWIQINCVLFARPIMVQNSSLHLMKLQICLSAMIQNKMKRYRLLQNKPVFWIIRVNAFTEFLTHFSPVLATAAFSHVIIIIIINSLTARIVGAPQMILQLVFSIFPFSPLPTGTCRTPGLSIPWCCLPTSSFVRLVFFPFSLCLARWF